MRARFVTGPITACLLAVLTACGSGDPEAASEPEPEPTSSPRSDSEPDPSPSPREETVEAGTIVITIEEFAYSDPGTVPPGAEITVENTDETAHTVTADGAGGFDVTIAPGKSGTFSAPERAGRYAFVCSFHANMSGTLVVR